MSKDVREDDMDELHAELSKMEKVFPVFTPDMSWFETQIVTTQREMKKKLVRDLVLFWIMAIMIISVSLILINRFMIIYIVLQIVALLSFLKVTFYFRSKRKVGHE